MAVVLGLYAGDAAHLAIWIAIVFVSIVVHELGHALSMRFYGQPSRVVLHMAGGLTIPEPVAYQGDWTRPPLKPGQEILITFAGPAAGFLLAGAVIAGVAAAGGLVTQTPLFGLIPWPMALLPEHGPMVNWSVTTLIWVNLFWSLVNLAPVYPLDGGLIARHALVYADPKNGIRASLWISLITGAAVAVLAWLLLRSLLMVILFGLLAVQSYQALAHRAPKEAG